MVEKTLVIVHSVSGRAGSSIQWVGSDVALNGLLPPGQIKAPPKDGPTPHFFKNDSYLPVQIPTSGANKSRGVSSIGAVFIGCHSIFKIPRFEPLDLSPGKRIQFFGHIKKLVRHKVAANCFFLFTLARCFRRIYINSIIRMAGSRRRGP